MEIAASRSLANRELRNFGLVLAIMFPLFFSGILPWLFSKSIPFWPLYLGGAILAMAVTLPKSMVPIHYVWMRIGFVLGYINTRIILGIVFFLVVWPIGLLARLVGKDFMRAKIDKSLDTYKEESENRAIETMKEPF